jgi:hypothetical protein
MIGFQAAAFVAAASALGAMGGSLVADYFQALGASGIVAGVVGALLFEEFRRPERIPAPWRLSRGLLVGAIAADVVLLAFLPGIAHAAHLGGFVAGVGAAAAVTPRDPLRPARPAWLGAANLGAAGIAAASALALFWAVWGPGPGAVRARAERLLVLEGVHPQILNNEAWMIAISESPDPELLAVARRMAERAVEATGRRDPNVLDTLAEVQFAAGDATAAVATIDEAIALAPHEDYFEEQRRRFTGERAADDRPEPPEGPVEPLPLPDPETSPGIRVRVPSPVPVAGADAAPGALRG